MRLWDPGDGRELRRLEGHTGGVLSVFALETGGRTVLASASGDGTVRLWDPGDGRELPRLEGHTSWVYAVRALEVHGHTLLAVPSGDRTVRLWDPTTGRRLVTIAVRHPATALTAVGSMLFVGVSSGPIALELNIEPEPT